MATQPMTNKNNRQSPPSGTARQKQGGSDAKPIADQAQGYLERGNEQIREMVEDHEGQTVLVALALGFGIGIAIGYSLAGPSEPKHSRWINRSTAEGIGRTLLQRIDQLLPETISSRIHH